MSSFNREQGGQGLVEYALILVLVALVSIGILTVLGPQVGNVFSRVNLALSGSGCEGSGNCPPYADLNAFLRGTRGLEFDACGSFDPDGGDFIVRYEFDFTSDKTYDRSGTNCSVGLRGVPPSGNYTATVRVTDSNGATSSATDTYTVP